MRRSPRVVASPHFSSLTFLKCRSLIRSAVRDAAMTGIDLEKRCSEGPIEMIEVSVRDQDEIDWRKLRKFNGRGDQPFRAAGECDQVQSDTPMKTPDR